MQKNSTIQRINIRYKEDNPHERIHHPGCGAGGAAVRPPDIDIIASGQAAFIQRTVNGQAGSGRLRARAGAGQVGVK